MMTPVAAPSSSAGQAEVHDLDLPGGQDVDVAGLEVAVHEALGVGEGEPVEDLLHDLELLLEPQGGALLDQVAQVGALEQLHRHVGDALLLAELVDGDDVRVGQLARGPRLLEEAPAALLVAAQLLGDDLDRDVAVEDRVVGAEHLPHRSLADLRVDPVLADLLGLHLPLKVAAGRARRPGGGLRRAIVAWPARRFRGAGSGLNCPFVRRASSRSRRNPWPSRTAA